MIILLNGNFFLATMEFVQKKRTGFNEDILGLLSCINELTLDHQLDILSSTISLWAARHFK